MTLGMCGRPWLQERARQGGRFVQGYSQKGPHQDSIPNRLVVNRQYSDIAWDFLHIFHLPPIVQRVTRVLRQQTDEGFQRCPFVEKNISQTHPGHPRQTYIKGFKRIFCGKAIVQPTKPFFVNSRFHLQIPPDSRTNGYGESKRRPNNNRFSGKPLDQQRRALHNEPKQDDQLGFQGTNVKIPPKNLENAIGRENQTFLKEKELGFQDHMTRNSAHYHIFRKEKKRQPRKRKILHQKQPVFDICEETTPGSPVQINMDKQVPHTGNVDQIGNRTLLNPRAVKETWKVKQDQTINTKSPPESGSPVAITLPEHMLQHNIDFLRQTTIIVLDQKVRELFLQDKEQDKLMRKLEVHRKANEMANQMISELATRMMYEIAEEGVILVGSTFGMEEFQADRCHEYVPKMISDSAQCPSQTVLLKDLVEEEAHELENVHLNEVSWADQNLPKKISINVAQALDGQQEVHVVQNEGLAEANKGGLEEPNFDMMVDSMIVGVVADKLEADGHEELPNYEYSWRAQGLTSVEEVGSVENLAQISCSISQSDFDPFKVSKIFSPKRPRGRPLKSSNLRDEIELGIQLTLNFERNPRKSKKEAEIFLSKLLTGSRRARSSLKNE
ncbi:hypothetical protein SUGI_0362320 [Cryptomeria japonica]|nr:hypothetical protein SUGI_0362320 [Cryptomeria japonica]